MISKFSPDGAPGSQADLESSAIAGLHHIESASVEIEDRKPGCKRLLEGFATSRSHRIVELGAAEIGDGRQA